MLFVFFCNFYSIIPLWKCHNIQDVFFDFGVYFLEDIFLVLNDNPPDDEIGEQQERKAQKKNQAIRDD
jgi:hypothetical protein